MPKLKKVRCVETGRVFNSMNEAGDFMDIAPQNISSAVRGKHKTAGGYRWEYVNDEPPKPKGTTGMTIRQVLRECERRTKETGRFCRYADIQKEETLQLIKEGKLCHTRKRK